MKKVILLTPLSGNGGIASWSRKFIKTFNQDEFQIIPIDRSIKGRTFDDNRLWSRFYAGIKEMIQIRAKVKAEIKNQEIDILHTTTSGSLGTFRDYIISNLCKKHGIKTIMHCRYGCITEDVRKGMYGKFLRKTMRNFDQIWVLDSRSLNTLKQIKELENKVFLTPNSIEVTEDVDIKPKTYHHIAFIANLVPTKGLFELVEAFKRLNRKNVKLSIVGKGTPEVEKHLSAEVAGHPNIHLLGLLPNDKAVEFMKSIDILALPTYMSHEAFPISILEAMSQGKMVISTKRAAIGDMLTGLDGKPCGCFVEEKSIEDITKAIEWCLSHTKEADEICRNAYEKVYSRYRTDVVYGIYAQHYNELTAL